MAPGSPFVQVSDNLRRPVAELTEVRKQLITGFTIDATSASFKPEPIAFAQELLLAGFTPSRNENSGIFRIEDLPPNRFKRSSRS